MTNVMRASYGLTHHTLPLLPVYLPQMAAAGMGPQRFAHRI